MYNLPAVLAWLAVAIGFGAVTVRRGSLSVGGALTAVALGGIVIATAGPRWLLPLVLFFGSSTALGRLLPAGGAASDLKDRQPRDVVQVLCNGGIYGFVAAAGLPPLLLLVVMAVATADTWASEIGKYLRRPTYDILRGRRVPPGLSGGVSTAGTLGGAAGAALIGMLGWVVLADYTSAQFTGIVALGFAGMVVDSVLGAGLQARYQDPDGKLSDARRARAIRVSGWGWMTNDLVNLLAIAATTAAAYHLLG